MATAMSSANIIQMDVQNNRVVSDNKSLQASSEPIPMTDGPVVDESPAVIVRTVTLPKSEKISPATHKESPTKCDEETKKTSAILALSALFNSGRATSTTEKDIQTPSLKRKLSAPSSLVAEGTHPNSNDSPGSIALVSTASTECIAPVEPQNTDHLSSETHPSNCEGKSLRLQHVKGTSQPGSDHASTHVQDLKRPRMAEHSSQIPSSFPTFGNYGPDQFSSQSHMHQSLQNHLQTGTYYPPSYHQSARVQSMRNVNVTPSPYSNARKSNYMDMNVNKNSGMKQSFYANIRPESSSSSLSASSATGKGKRMEPQQQQPGTIAMNLAYDVASRGAMINANGIEENSSSNVASNSTFTMAPRITTTLQGGQPIYEQHPIHDSLAQMEMVVQPQCSLSMTPLPIYSRKDKSLGLLCQNFMARYQHLKVSGFDPPCISIDEAASSLQVERRRIYDIINILEAIKVVERKCKNVYYWYGMHNFRNTLKALQKEAMVEWGEDAVKNGLMKDIAEVKAYLATDIATTEEQKEVPVDASASGLELLLASAEQMAAKRKQAAISSNQKKERKKKNVAPKEKSLGRLSEKFVQLFMVGYNVLALTDASDKILGKSEPPPPLPLHATKQERSKANATASRKLKTKIRRLYDIANVFVSLGFVEKLNGGNNMINSSKNRPSFRWIHSIKPQSLITGRDEDSKTSLPPSAAKVASILNMAKT